MIDTIHFKIDFFGKTGIRINQSQREWINNFPEEEIKYAGGSLDSAGWIKVNLRNMEITQTENGIKVEGSIAKFFNGNNARNFTREMYYSALSEFEGLTGLDLNLARLKRVDFGKCIITEKNVSQYLRLFSFLPRYKQDLRIGGGGLETVLYFTKSGSYAFCAYDKIQEMNDKNEKIPDFFKDCNLLRMEYRILDANGIREKLGAGENLTPWDLTVKETYKNLAGLYKDFYKSIPKVGRNIFFDRNKQYTPAEIAEILAEAKRQSDIQFSNDLINTLHKNGNLTELNYKRIKAAEKKNMQNYTFSDTNELIVELDEKNAL